MKRSVLVFSAIIFFATFAAARPWASAETYGRICALKRRADTVMRQKNDFVARVLHFYSIPCQRTEQGVVTRLQMGSKWLDVHRIEIVPLARQGEDGLRVTGHDIFFYTEDEILHLVSALTIR